MAMRVQVEEEHPDLIVTMGGDGTILYVASLFQGIMPPIVCFNFGWLYNTFRIRVQSLFDILIFLPNHRWMHCVLHLRKLQDRSGF